jgi:hypothetical protein
MTLNSSGAHHDRIWLCMGDSNRTRILSRALAKGQGMVVYMGPTLDREGPIGLILADDAHAPRIAEAKQNAAACQKSLLVTANGARAAAADIHLDHDTDAGTLSNAIDGLRGYRDYEVALGRNSDLRVGAITSLNSGEFSVRTLDDARDVATFIAQGCPRTCQVAVGIYVLLANAIEHGNLEISSTEKAKAMAEGKWRRMIVKRQGENEYARRRVRVKFQRGGRVISLVIQDDGPGIDAETAEMANPTGKGYRAKGIKMAKTLGFSQVSYLGVGNIVEATILLTQAKNANDKMAFGR